MQRYSLRRMAAATTGGFSSAAFTGDDGGTYDKLKGEQARLRRDNQSGAADTSQNDKSTPHRRGADDWSASGSSSRRGQGPSSSSFSTGGATDFSSATFASNDDGSSSGGGGGDATAALERPTIDTYRAMTDEQLTDTLRLRDEQVAQLRRIYENFHYEADKHFRKMIFDYHDKTMQLSQVHGKMQQASLQINREALARMRDEQDRMTRDKRLIFTLCTIWSLIFWIWVRRHYVQRRELEQEPLSAMDRAVMNPSVTGAGSYGNNFFGSSKRSGRFAETSWEREVRERREAQDARDRQLALLRHQEEVVKAVAARDGESEVVAASSKNTGVEQSKGRGI
ncbi:hypothetical protein NQL31_005589 [Lotmaria passim]